MPLTLETESRLIAILSRARESFAVEGTPSRETRIDRIDRCVSFMVDQQEAIVAATQRDWRNKPANFVKALEVLPVVNHAKYVKRHLKSWMRDERRNPDTPFGLLGAKALVRYEPLGVVGIMVPWNGPLAMSMIASIDAFSAGNRVMIKVSEFSPNAAEFMAAELPRYFDATELSVVCGEVDVSKAFASLPFDHLLYTGNPETARQVMAAASRNLVPVTLELGGKTPVIVGEDVDLEFAANRIASGRLANSGQVCIAPDYVLLPKHQLEPFLEYCTSAVESLYPQELGGRDYVSIATDRHYERTLKLIDDAKRSNSRILNIDVGTDSKLRQIDPTIVIDPPENCRLMQEEIFGPILVVRTTNGIDEAIRFVNDRPKPLALYYFGDNKREQDEVLRRTTSGGAAVNEVLLQQMQSDLPFGGVGNSGTGNYWGGRSGFDRFSHQRSIFKQGWYRGLGAMLDPPYGKAIERTLRLQLKADAQVTPQS